VQAVKIWKVLPGEKPEQIEVSNPVEAARQIIAASMDFTKVRYLGKLRTMAVDDEGMCKNLPVNDVATKAYLANCYEGTLWSIHGPAVIFEGVLR
jgi:hypothetical protein